MPRVLLVDDDPDYRLVLRLALDGQPGLEVAGEAGDAIEAGMVAAATRPDLVVLDCELPGADGFDALPEIRAACPEARVVLVSGHPEADVWLAARAVGALGHVSKETPARRLGRELASVAGLVDVVQAALEELATRLDADTRSAGTARRFVADALQRWGLDEVADTVVLLVSELVTNAVVHARSGPDVLVRLVPDAVRVEVTDQAAGRPVPQVTEPEDTSGRGLALVEALARDWGVDQRPRGHKTVWFEVARPEPEPAPL